ncbi:antiterminator LoaP [Thermoclostridium caenicola]|uniref:Transcription termination/antitermination protein NusG n=1 Tax=Thermoclostridium caenicola TaxID=659425 RepID=A0A1M6J3Y1_9FIRM|nr:antiterminator LoaP [Thermoclostridium caenicola]SHJ41372.1 transcriptional antiterminator NusG [Thermoclostridium caenicola]
MDWREKLRNMTKIEDEDESQQWHAVFVLTGNEDPVKEKIEYALGNSGVRAVVPKRRIMERKAGKWHERIRPLFPGYVLLQGKIDVSAYYILKTIPGLVRILKDERELYRIYPEEIEIISRLMCNGDIIGTSVAFKKGDRIVITDGPLLNMEGLITSVDPRKGRVKVRLSFLGDVRTVDLSISFIETA